MKKSKLLISALAGLGLYSATAQELSIDALIRPRFEYRHGFQDVVPDGTEGSSTVFQRSSLLVKYSDAKITTFLDLQDISIWGDRPQLSTNNGDGNNKGFRVNRAWAQINLGKGWATKVGRQFLSYDDQRILGALGWLDQQRTHDAALLKYANNGLKLDVGFSFNQNGPNNFNNIFTPSGPAQDIFQYKAMQFLHINKKFSDKFSGSFLFMSNQFQNSVTTTTPAVEAADAVTTTITDDMGVPQEITLSEAITASDEVTSVSRVEGTNSRQTTGIYGKYKQGKFGLDFSGYYQFGEIGSSGQEISAYDLAANATYKAGSTLLGLGVEVLSGNDLDSEDQEAFFPLFGTNHKFNGYQDFFYVGRHANAEGLVDINAKAVFKTGAKSKLVTALHYFSTAEDGASYDGYIGTAVDLVFVQKINAYSNVKVGYSQSFLDSNFADARASRGSAVPLEADSVQNFGWVMLTIKPNIFKWKKPAETK